MKIKLIEVAENAYYVVVDGINSTRRPLRLEPAEEEYTQQVQYYSPGNTIKECEV